ncbi:hypothetical protein AB4392_11455 [Vibrio breoganii]
MIRKLFSIALVAILAGCSSGYQSVNQVPDVSFVQLEGNFVGKTMLIDGQELVLKNVKTFSENDREVARFPIDNGTHRIIVKSGDELLIDKKFITATGEVFKVVVP